MEKMWDKKRKMIVHVATMFRDNHLIAVVYNPSMAGNQNGNGWEIVRAKHLIPMEYFDDYSEGFMSKSYRNKMKERLEIVSIELMTTDGQIFDSYNKATEHESELYEAERKDARAQMIREKFDLEEHSLSRALEAQKALEEEQPEDE